MTALDRILFAVDGWPNWVALLALLAVAWLRVYRIGPRARFVLVTFTITHAIILGLIALFIVAFTHTDGTCDISRDWIGGWS